MGLVGVWWVGGIPLPFEPPELQKRDVLLEQGFAIVLVGAIAAVFRRTLDRRVAEQQSARLEALRAAESRDRFLANVTHDLRTPLVGALGTARLLISEGQDDTVQQELVAIERRGTQLQALLDSVAARKGAALVQTVVDVDGLLAELVEGWAGVVLDAPELPPVVLDGRSLREVPSRLLTHAQRDAGSVNVRVRRSGDVLTLDLTASPAWGEGDAQSLTRQRVERLGGSLTIGLDEGQRARFALPAAFVSSPELSVLIVEDNPTNAAVTLGMLRHLGHAGHVVGDGASALQVLTERAFDIVLLDLRLPDMSGYEVFERIESGPRVVALTASTDERQNVTDSGLHGFLAKPSRLEELRAVLRGA
ncbi:MAG: response regulator [Proteobacteria bacterium]|nr:response regulator [Pseudomonadota bacterium]MCP4918759.1 response regulator [Pseudomonadota bacterium]